LERIAEFRQTGVVDLGEAKAERKGTVGHVTLLNAKFLNAEDDRATAGIVYAYTASAVFWLLVGSAYGTLAACKLVWPDLLPFEWLSFGRIRPIHTASILLGWLSVGLTGIAISWCIAPPAGRCSPTGWRVPASGSSTSRCSPA